ncbi:MAG: hypothetical protein WAM71_04630 [Candidatus Korobacteraceae bacterium]
MKATEEKSETRVSAEVEQTIRERLLTLNDDRKKAVDARKAIAEIRRNLKFPKPH